MRLKHINAFLLAFAVMLSASLISCKAKNTDAEIQTEVNKQLADEAGSSLNASVSNGVVTLTGTCKDEECRRSCAEEVKGVKGVKDVVNNITVATTSTAPVEVTADAPLQEAVNNVLKEYKDVKAEVKDGVVTLRGEIKRDNLQELMAAVNALKPKKVDNQLAIK
ncbi:MAG TPA: BON domain-containing protein [Chitinophagaceae bacterium]